jgi:hypothetical protein
MVGEAEEEENAIVIGLNKGRGGGRRWCSSNGRDHRVTMAMCVKPATVATGRGGR